MFLLLVIVLIKMFKMNLGGIEGKVKANDFGPDFYSFLLEDDPKPYGEEMGQLMFVFVNLEGVK